MENYTDWTKALNETVSSLVDRLAQHLPNILGALALLLVGWFMAKVLRLLAIRFTRFLDTAVQNYSRKKGIERSKLPSNSGKVLGETIYWIVFLIFITTATHVLNLNLFTDWLSRVVAYLPTLLAGGLIILAGVLVSSIARDLLVAALPEKDKEQRALLGNILYIAILATAIVIGVDQIGINVTFLVILLSITVGTFLTGLAIAVGLGSKTIVSNMISAHHLKQHYKVGDQIRIWDYSGRITAVTATNIVLDTEDGIVTLPARVYSENPILKIPETIDGD